MNTSTMDAVNSAAWSGAANRYAAVEGLGLPEQCLLERLRDEVADKAVLDLGVGTGRTTPHLLALKPCRYVGGDLSAAMVTIARRRWPNAEIVEIDARDLSRFANDTFALVLFSANGIDYVGHEDRLRVLAEVRRVLAPGGAFVFSSHNLRADAARRRGLIEGFEPPPFVLALDPVLLARRTARFVVDLALSAVNRARLHRHEQRGEGYAIVNDRAQSYGCLTYYVELEAQREQLRAAAFAPDVEALDLAGARADHRCKDDWIHYLARKPRASN